MRWPPTDKLYTGQQRETADGIYYYGARFYNADVGRFIQADTIVQAPFNPQSLNRYSYVFNNPVRYNDPTGHYAPGIDCESGCPMQPEHPEFEDWVIENHPDWILDMPDWTGDAGQAIEDKWNDFDPSVVPLPIGIQGPSNAIRLGRYVVPVVLSGIALTADELSKVDLPDVDLPNISFSRGEGDSEKAEEALETDEIPGDPFTGENAAERAYEHLEKHHGVDPSDASERLHKIKQKAGLGAADNAIIGKTGDVYDPRTVEHIGNLITER